MARDPYKKFPIGTLVKVAVPTPAPGPAKQIVGLVVPMLEGATMSPTYFLTVYLSEPHWGERFRLVSPGQVTSLSRNYVKEKL